MDSTKLGEARISEAMQALEGCAGRIEHWHTGPLRFTRHRGDGWQVVLEKPAYALRAAIAFRATLKSLDDTYDSRIGIATGEVAMPLGPDLNVQSAEPFVVSGRALEIARRSDHWINYSLGGAFEATAILLDRIAREWTQPQATAMAHALHPLNEPEYTEIARKLGKSRQAVTKSLHAAWYLEARTALTMLESALL
ncbi:MAG: hypothetical protein R3D84_17540 [Paracoccaceae bacterium]